MRQRIQTALSSVYFGHEVNIIGKNTAPTNTSFNMDVAWQLPTWESPSREVQSSEDQASELSYSCLSVPVCDLVKDLQRRRLSRHSRLMIWFSASI